MRILARLSFVDFSLKWGGRVVFHLDLGTPNCGTRQLATCVYSHCNIGNIQVKHMKTYF
jgi:hypothetical protein